MGGLSETMDDLMPEKDLKNLEEQLENVLGDKDRIRLINAATRGWRFTTDQVFRLCEACHYGDAGVHTASKLYSATTDPDNFEEGVINKFKFAEDKAAIKAKTGVGSVKATMECPRCKAIGSGKFCGSCGHSLRS